MRKIGSFFLTLFVCFVILACVTISLDLVGVVKLPENLSLKKYLSKSIGVLGGGEEVYYPDYDATGLNAESKLDKEAAIEEIKSHTTVKNEINQEEIDKILNDIRGDEASNVSNQNYNVTDNSYFYTQLDTYGKTLYSRLYANLDNLKTGLYVVDFGTTFNDLLHTQNGEKILTDAFQLSINALLLDHPEIFYLDVTKMYMFTETTKNFAGTTYKISIGPDENNSYLLPELGGRAEIINAESNIKAVLDSVINSLNGSVYDKILQVHNFLIDNVVYDEAVTESAISHTLYGALINKVAVCDGYAKAFKYILDRAGISCVEICGIAQNSAGESESHAWNYVLLNGRWYAVDVTWDDPIIVGGNGRLTNELRYNYFLKGSDTFFATHQEDGYIVTNGEFDYPIISSNGY